jgi:crotonobetainyl-CoA:carnitine CoA-transferase CaiB-like acyl-CoA transferase
MEGTFAPVLGLPAQFSSLTPNAPTAPPEIGGHNAEILSELGLSEAQIEELEAKGII